jgi:hypothetical protein
MKQFVDNGIRIDIHDYLRNFQHGADDTRPEPPAPMPVADMIVAAGYARSKNEARRLIEQGGVRFGFECIFTQRWWPEDVWAPYYGSAFIDVCGPRTDIHGTFSVHMADGYMLVGKRNACRVTSIGHFTAKVHMHCITEDSSGNIRMHTRAVDV